MPAEGPIEGGTIITLNGANFTGAKVQLDHAVVNPLTQSDAEVTLRSPKHDNGYALIQIGSAAAEFLYLPPALEDVPPGFITTVAGAGRYLRLEMPATQTAVNSSDLTITPAGDIYFMQVDRGLLFRIDTQGILHHVAGRLAAFDFNVIGDGAQAKNAVFGFARSVAIDAAGNAYITDARARIRKIDAVTGVVTTIAGTGEMGFSGDGGPATQAKIGEPSHIACKPDGTLYFIEGLPLGNGGTPRNLRVRKVTPDGSITTVAGNGTIGDDGDGGPAVNASLNIGVDDGGDIAVDPAGNVFVLEVDGQRVRRIDAQTGTITTFASLAFPPPNQNRSIGSSALAIDPAGNVFVATSWNFFKYDPTGRRLDSWGVTHGFSEDGTPFRQMSVGGSLGMAIAPNGDIVYGDEQVGRIRKINITSGKIETIAGLSPRLLGVPGKALGAVFLSTYSGLAFLAPGELLLAAGGDNWVLRFDLRSGTVATFAGTGMFCCQYEEASTDVVGVTANSLAVDETGNVYFADKMTIRFIDPQGRVHRAAGLPNGRYGLSGDGGPARDALLCQPNDVVLDANGNLLIADTNNNRIRRVDKVTGIITTVVGSGPSNGFEGYRGGSFCGDGGQAIDACLNTPIAVAISRDGTMYINDFFNNPKIRKVASDGTISSIQSPQPMKLVIGPGGSVFATGPGRIFRLDHDRVRVLAGTGAFGFSGDGGPATLAQLAPGGSEWGEGLAIDAEGNLFFHDAGNARIRAIRYGAVLAPPNATVQVSSNGSAVRATVFDSEGRTAPGVRVEFNVPAAGASCTLSSPFAITNEDGLATVTCTPNCVAGTYSVTARPLTASSTATVSLSNAGGPCRRRGVRH